MTVAEVRLWGRRIGAVSTDDGDRVASFEYDPEFRGSGIEVSPLTMPLNSRIYQFPGLPEAAFKGLPGLLADSLPDRYGNALVDAWLARQGRSADSFNVVERLCYVGTRGMGALEYHPSHGPRAGVDDVDVAALVQLADEILRKRKGLEVDLDHDEEAMNRILEVGTSAGGARAKAIIAFNEKTGMVRSGQAGLEPGFTHWILKLDGVRSSDDHEVGTTLGYGRIEYAYHEMARAAGITMTRCRLLSEGGRRHFMTRRFDRTGAGGKIHLQSLAALGHFDFNAPGAVSCEQAIEVMRRLALTHEEIEEQFRRAIFNIVARNQDDHVKNIAFLMDRGGRWSLSPAYDIVYACNPAGAWTSRHQMSLNGKREGFVPDDLMTFARFCNLKAPRAKRIVAGVVAAVAAWPDFARAAGVDDARIGEVEATLRTSLA